MVAAADLDSLLGLILDRGVELLAAERATVFLYDAATDELVSRVAHGGGEFRMPGGRGIAGAVVRGRAVVLVPDAYADERFNREFDRASGFRTRNLLAVPLLGGAGELVGVLEVINRRDGAFGKHEVFLAETLAAQAGVAVQRAELQRHYVQKQRMQQSLDIAREIQRDLLPRQAPRLEGWDIAGFTQPADETGGDFYDYIPMAGGRLAVAVGDASGHGIGPALVMAATRAMIRVLMDAAPGPGKVLRAVNAHLAEDLGEGRFVTCFLGVLDAGGSLTYASAGHGPLLVRTGGQCAEQGATGMLMGPFAGVSFAQNTLHLGRGDLAVVPTDGLFEAMNPAGEPFGVRRVIDLLNCPARTTAGELCRSLLAAAESFTAGGPQMDDVSAVVMRRV